MSDAQATWRAGAEPPDSGGQAYWLAVFEPKTGPGWVEQWFEPLPKDGWHPNLLVVVGPIEP